MFDFNSAEIIAVKQIKKIVETSSRLRKYKFEDAGFLRENEFTWTFSAPSLELQNEGIVPGAISVSVDKKDGHIWTTEEQAEFYTALQESRKPQLQVA
jgi:hypothetical protein